MNILLKENERIDDLGRGMKIIQSSSTPCFSIDAVLLADFVHVGKHQTIVDLGTGTGIIPLLLSRKMPDAKIFAIELIEQMYSQAKRSIELNNLTDRIKIVCDNLLNATQYWGKCCADIVVTNPPYYKIGHGKVNNDAVFAAARSEKHCTLLEIIETAAILLKQGGISCTIIRAERLAELLFLLTSKGLNPEKLRIIQPYTDKEANLALVAARKNGHGNLHILPPLVVYEQTGQYTKEMRQIYER